MARNRKRAKERRPRQSVAAPGSRPSGAEVSLGRGVATARPEDEREPLLGEPEAQVERDPAPERRDEATPSPLAHATPDAELADAQLALGRSEAGADLELDDDEQAEVYEDEMDLAPDDGPGAAVSVRAGAADSSAVPAVRQSLGTRIVHFLQGSWRELQRVQWPNRQQVMQATGVVIGFVIIAGLFLGLADLVATKLVNLILQ